MVGFLAIGSNLGSIKELNINDYDKSVEGHSLKSLLADCKGVGWESSSSSGSGGYQRVIFCLALED